MSTRGIKVVLVGDSFTGKTSLIQRLVTDDYLDTHLSTVVSSCFQKTIHLSDRDMNINIWDTAGQERFRSLASNFFRDAQGIIICYDVTSPKSLTSIPMWINEKENKAEDNVIWMLVGCKSDQQINVDETKVKEIIDRYGVLHMTCSAKTGTNVNEVFVTLCERINEILQDPINDIDDEPDLINVNQNSSTTNSQKDSKCNC
ncbi:small GTPase rabi, putative [Entamoeba dispar SAW760]|uniref:Small GTPase rabi, putative n=1 Tax=Entamoeba dispar (strain ATCC PRA-260 / SAW760) TaxID=370354 RepID=B0EK11_ENTDS|nr:small GTPase rabi, putative [Entamoeba dispar SAW760]EDR25138.1 small GTPase rabi, putative [Entamoeba dispar SAW760]|eukprot:EDR25138.1 small GTPase rabi, putative [Entamoeba dispar SAW760]